MQGRVTRGLSSASARSAIRSARVSPARLARDAAPVLAAGTLLFHVSPQVQSLRLNGHLFPGAYYVVLVGALACVDLAHRGALKAVVQRHAITCALICVFVAQAAARLQGVDYEAIGAPDGEAFAHQYSIELAFLVPLIVLIGAIAELGATALRRMRTILVAGFAVSLAAGVPLLWAEPQIARTTMGFGAFSADMFRRLSPLGIGNYLHYTPFALVTAAMLGHARTMGPWSRIVTVVVILAGGVAVVLSTFTMAYVVLGYSLVAAFGIWAFTPVRLVHRLARASLAVAVGLVAASGVTAAASVSPSVAFVFEKASRLFTGIAGSGLAAGDETGRGAWFVESLTYLTEENPVLGFVDGVTRFASHGHSSLMDTFVLFGAVGVLWLYVLWRLFLWATSGQLPRFQRYVVHATFLGFLWCGILNPVWFALSFIAPMLALTVPSREQCLAGRDLQNSRP